ncbi:hypothetical protein SCLARK_001799 [Spiroplasma clarkii]|nr:hypothetical protein SCLARK_001799 [Spiroplasma clarkii]
MDSKNIVEDFYIKDMIDFDFNTYQLKFMASLNEPTLKRQHNELEVLLKEFLEREKKILKIEKSILKELETNEKINKSDVDKIAFKNIIFHSGNIKKLLTSIGNEPNISKKLVKNIRYEVKKFLIMTKRCRSTYICMKILLKFIVSLNWIYWLSKEWF